MAEKKSKLGSDVDPMTMFKQMIDKKIPDLTKTEKAKSISFCFSQFRF